MGNNLNASDISVFDNHVFLPDRMMHYMTLSTEVYFRENSSDGMSEFKHRMIEVLTTHRLFGIY